MVKEHKRSHLTARALAQHAQRLAEEHPDPEQILQRRDVNDSMTRQERERGRYMPFDSLEPYTSGGELALMHCAKRPMASRSFATRLAVGLGLSMVHLCQQMPAAVLRSSSWFSLLALSCDC